jgi:hypothetical protein
VIPGSGAQPAPADAAGRPHGRDRESAGMPGLISPTGGVVTWPAFESSLHYRSVVIFG